MSKKLILKIHEKGRLVKLPGMAEFRTPATVEVTNIPLQTLIFKLNEFSISDYELESYTENKKIVYQKQSKRRPKQELPDLPEEYINSLNKRFLRMENLIGKVLNNTSVRPKQEESKEEQINKRLDRIERLLKEKPKLGASDIDYKDLKDPKVEDDEDFDVFIPKFETEGMKFSGGEHKEIEGDGDADDTADALSSLLKDDRMEE